MIGHPAESVESTMAARNFPWYDTESGTVRKIVQPDPGRAGSLDRSRIPPHVEKVPTSNKTGSPATFSGNSAPSSGVAGDSSLLFWLFLALVAAITVVLVYLIFRQPESADTTGGVTAEDLRHRITQLPFDLKSELKGDFREMAQQSAAKGDYGRATMMLFSHVLLHLDRKGLIQLKKGKTNRRYLSELRSHPELVSFYRNVMVPFEDAFFGNHEISSSRFERCWNGLNQFHQDTQRAVLADQS